MSKISTKFWGIIAKILGNSLFHDGHHHWNFGQLFAGYFFIVAKHVTGFYLNLRQFSGQRSSKTTEDRFPNWWAYKMTSERHIYRIAVINILDKSSRKYSKIFLNNFSKFHATSRLFLFEIFPNTKFSWKFYSEQFWMKIAQILLISHKSYS